MMRLLAVVTAALCLWIVPAAAQAPKPAPWTGARRPDGQPDVQGFWVTIVYGMGCLSNPRSGPGCVDEFPDRPARPKAPSRVIDTTDGDVPYQPWAREKQKHFVANFAEPTSPEFIDPQQLCLPLGAVRQITWHDIHLLQYDGYVVFVHEGGHSNRVIPVDGRPHASANIKLWMGDSRGHWEGNTLVVDVANSNSKGRLSRSGDFASDKVHIVERFTFLDANRARYEAVFDDPSVYTRPWTFGLDLKRGVFDEGALRSGDENYEHWEEACHEGLKDVDSSLRSPASANPERK
jgi:hypothetical protein